MNYEELVEELNFETDNEERQKEAKALKKKLKRIAREATPNETAVLSRYVNKVLF